MEEQTNEIKETNNNNDVFVVNGVANYSFVKGSSNNTSTLSSLLGMFYKMGWYCKQWTEIKKYNESYKNISPFWRGIFYIGYASKFKKIVVELFEARTNMILRNDNVPQEEKDKWQKELKKLKSIFAKFSLQQEAINKIVPIGHPEGGSSKFAGLLGLPVFVLLILIIFGFSAISALFDNCFEAEGNVLKNTCHNYSLTFPLSGEIQTTHYYHCQGTGGNYVCVGEMARENPNEPEPTLDQLAEEEYNPVLHKFTKQYANKTTHCFKEKDDTGYYYQCYMKIEEVPGLHLGFLASDNNLENLEKLMNSYKNL